eukprot:scaffold46752_cov20-Tisochrysis_lutea.AAC.1
MHACARAHTCVRLHTYTHVHKRTHLHAEAVLPASLSFSFHAQILTTPMPKMPDAPLVKFERAEDNPGLIV